MSRRRPQAAIPEPYTDVMSLRSSVMAIKELVEDLTGQRGGDGTTAVTQDDLDAALGDEKVSKSGDTMTGTLTVNANINASSVVRIYSTAGNANAHIEFVDTAGTHKGWMYCDVSNVIRLSPNACPADLTIDTAGHVAGGVGYTTRTAMNGSYGSNWFNFYWTGSGLNVYVDNSYMGVMAYQSDYRIKKDVFDLTGMWETVKALRPVSYTQAEYGLFTADDLPRWGFIAHELQETMIDSAASGHKDEEDTIQSPNPWTLLAALTKALQEAMTRIEALEAKLG